MEATQQTNPPVLPPDVYAIFCGGIEQATAQKIANGLTLASVGNAKHVHIAFQSAGGFVGDGVFLYNIFRALPIEITLYNVGQLSSAGVIAYLGAKTRITSAKATFLIHRSTNNLQFATSTKLQHVAKSLILDDERTDAILRERVKLPTEMWAELDYHDIYLSGEEAVKFGIATAIGEFEPPPGTQVYNLMAN